MNIQQKQGVTGYYYKPIKDSNEIMLMSDSEINYYETVCEGIERYEIIQTKDPEEVALDLYLPQKPSKEDMRCLLAFKYFEVFAINPIDFFKRERHEDLDEDIEDISDYSNEENSQPEKVKNSINLDELERFYYGSNFYNQTHKSKFLLSDSNKERVKQLLYSYLIKEKHINKIVIENDTAIYILINKISNRKIINIMKFLMFYNIIPKQHFEKKDKIVFREQFYNIFNQSYNNRNSTFEKAMRKKSLKEVDPYGLFDNEHYSKIFFKIFRDEWLNNPNIKFIEHRISCN